MDPDCISERLNPEILCEIFAHVITDKISSWREVIRVAGVCQQWRDIALSRIWHTVFHCHTPEFALEVLSIYNFSTIMVTGHIAFSDSATIRELSVVIAGIFARCPSLARISTASGELLTELSSRLTVRCQLAEICLMSINERSNLNIVALGQMSRELATVAKDLVFNPTISTNIDCLRHISGKFEKVSLSANEPFLTESTLNQYESYVKCLECHTIVFNNIRYVCNDFAKKIVTYGPVVVTPGSQTEELQLHNGVIFPMGGFYHNIKYVTIQSPSDGVRANLRRVFPNAKIDII